MKILWLSPFAPYDTVGHGGGQNHNYYLKYVKDKTDFDITLLSVCNKGEKEKLDLEQYDIDNIIKIYDNTLLITKIRVLLGKIIVNRDGGLFNNAKYILLEKAIEEYLLRGEYPDIIITQWIEATEFIEKLKLYYPKSKYIAIEEDVAFLGYQRKYKNSHGISKVYKRYKFKKLKKMEISLLSKCDLVIPLNNKDKSILESEGIQTQKMLQACSYHGCYDNCIYNPNVNQLLFFGAMSRHENWKSIIWFIQNVMPLLDRSYKLIVAGSNPGKKLMKYESDRIHFTGFVKNIQPYFENSLCLISPLLLGAGIKIKVLEALSAGLPVVANSIAAEGIGLTDQENYLYADLPIEYVHAINKLKQDSSLREKLSKNGKDYVSKTFNVNYALDRLIDKINNFNDICF